MTEKTLKPGWKIVKFGDVVRLNTDRVADPLAAGIERYVGLEHITPEDLHIHSWGLVAEGTTFTNYFKPGQVLFGKRRAYQRKVAMAEFEGVCSGDIYVFESKDPKVLLPELMPFICQTEGFYNYALETSAGSLSPRTNWSHLADYKFSIPPYEEQCLIAEVLWVADEVLQSYLFVKEKAVAFNKALIIELLEKPIGSNDCTLIPIKELANSDNPVLKTGPFGSHLKSEYFSTSGVPVLNISAVGDNEIEDEGLFYLPEEIAERFDSYRLFEDDIVFSRVAEIGRCMLIPKSMEGSIISSNLIRIRLDKTKVDPEYFFYLLKFSPTIQKQIRQVTTGGGRLLVNTNTLGKMVFPIPCLKYQDETVEIYKYYENQEAMVDQRIENLRRLIVTLHERFLS